MIVGNAVVVELYKINADNVISIFKSGMKPSMENNQMYSESFGGFVL